ncbi:hypothetical protein M413DRAFT_23403 [Hebeloma cylindrosporum]|uniref:Uncharacterized protein n=1 Tax=Hebeloma cylindrosporum TaxID=76867 RepID=A0A0C2Z1T5_HEBCY|nr:hypothetical protein M413DRAFT_23403 [Hebeloma cylindrosporum h7]
MYNRRSHSPNPSTPTAALLAGFGLRPKRKAPQLNKRPQKVPRQRSQSPNMMSIPGDSSSEGSQSDDNNHPGSWYDNYEEDVNQAANTEDPDVIEVLEVRGDSDVGDEDPDAIEPEGRSDVGDRDGGPEAPIETQA